MDYQVALSRSAYGDLRDIVRYISLDAPERALEFGSFLIAKTRALGQFPDIGREVPEIGDPAVREIIVRSYRIVYRISQGSKTIEIIRFWHAGRGNPKIGN